MASRPRTARVQRTHSFNSTRGGVLPSKRGSIPEKCIINTESGGSSSPMVTWRGNQNCGADDLWKFNKSSRKQSATRLSGPAGVIKT